ncbi:MAG: hypothetical protein ABW200_02345, partial [Hyphomicrobiaceae bacterium]
MQVDQIHRSISKMIMIIIIHFPACRAVCKASLTARGTAAGAEQTRETNMRNWNEVDLLQIDLAALS